MPGDPAKEYERRQDYEIYVHDGCEACENWLPYSQRCDLSHTPPELPRCCECWILDPYWRSTLDG